MPNQFGQLQDRGTTKALQVRFSLSPDYTLSLTPEVGAVIPLDMPELLFHQGWRRYQSAGTITAGVGNAARIQLRNPVGSNIITIVEAFVFFASVALEFVEAQMSPPVVADLTTIFGSSPRDYRQPNGKPGLCVVSGQQGAALSINTMIAGAPASTLGSMPGMPLELFPGDGVQFSSETLNQAVDFGILYRERVLQEQENTP